MGELTAEDQASAGRIAKRMLVHREAIRLVHNQESALVGLDRLQKLDDLIETVNDDTARGRSIRRVTRSCSDLINELIELLLIHETSPSVGAVSDTAITTVGDAADGSGSSPAGSSAALSGRGDILSASTQTQALLADGKVVPLVVWSLPGATATTPLLASENVVEIQDQQGKPLARRDASGALVPLSTEAGNLPCCARNQGGTK